MPPSTVRSVFTVLLTVSAAIGLAACGNEDPDPAPVSPTATNEPPSSPEAEPEPTEEPIGTPVDVACEEVAPPSAIDLLFSDFQPDPSYAPAAGSTADQMVQWFGKACGWVNSQGVVLEIVIAHLTEDKLTELKNELVVRSNSVPTYGVEGYFQVNGGVGEAEAFADPYWIFVASEHLFEPGDAAPVVESAIAAMVS